MEEDNTFEGGVSQLEGADTGTDIVSNNSTGTQTIVPATVCGGDTWTQPDTTSRDNLTVVPSVSRPLTSTPGKNFLFHPNNECTQRLRPLIDKTQQ